MGFLTSRAPLPRARRSAPPGTGFQRLEPSPDKFTRRCRMVAQSARRSAASYFGPTGLPGQAGGAQAGQPGLAHSPLFTHTGSGDTTRPGHVANDYNPPVSPQADPAPTASRNHFCSMAWPRRGILASTPRHRRMAWRGAHRSPSTQVLKCTVGVAQLCCLLSTLLLS